MFNRLLIILSIAFLSQPWAPPKNGVTAFLSEPWDPSENGVRRELYCDSNGLYMYRDRYGNEHLAEVGRVYRCDGQQWEPVAKILDKNEEKETYSIRLATSNERMVDQAIKLRMAQAGVHIE